MQLSAFGDLSKEATAVGFAGFGGACEGIRMAIGVSPIVAINHDEHAIRLHALNHPETKHYREDIWLVDPWRACRGRKLKLLWLSPDCTHHSRAKGKAPRMSGRRSLADVVFKWVETVRPAVIMLENVPEWLDWGPLDEHGKPISERKGELFRAWVDRLDSYGYCVEWRILEAHRYGVPTSRRRVYLIARCDGQPIVWPEPTHGPGLLPYRTAAECIDWSERWRTDLSVESLCRDTMRRIEHGRRLFGDSPFLVEYYGTGLSASLDAPLHTVTTVDRFGLVYGNKFRMLQPRELARAMGFPDSYILEGSKRDQVARIGNAVCPQMAEALVRANLGGV